MSVFKDPTFFLGGYVKLTEVGFALPCYRTSVRPNIWYVATCSVSGDHQGNIVGFEPFVSNDIHPIGRARRIKTGDPWCDVFLWEGKAFVGTPGEIWDAIASLRGSLKVKAPISLLDLAVAASSGEQRELALAAFDYVKNHFGEQRADHWWRNVLLRETLILSLRRVIVAQNLEASYDSLKLVQIVKRTGNSDLIAFPDGLATQLLLCNEMERVLQSLQALMGPSRLAFRPDPPGISTVFHNRPSHSGGPIQSRAASMTSIPPPEPAQTQEGPSFYGAVRAFPLEQREAMFLIYSFCRKVDDLADCGDREKALEGLQQWRVAINALYDKSKVATQIYDYLPVIEKFDLQREDFLSIIDGMEMDAKENIRAPAFGTLDLYCDRVASAVGRLSVRVFGLPDEDGRKLAYHLGRALQMTNILRDLDEDAAIGRLYLPREMLLEAGIQTTDPSVAMASSALPKASVPLVALAKTHFRTAAEVMDRHPRRAVRAPRLMSAYYSAILALLEQRGFAAPRKPISLSRTKKIAMILRYAFF